MLQDRGGQVMWAPALEDGMSQTQKELAGGTL